MSAPTKINTGNTRPVNRTDVLKADDPSVEREQLNRILKRIAERLDGVELAVASGGDSGNSDFVLLVNATQLDYEDGFLSIAPGGVGTTELASSAVTTIKIDDEAVTTAKIDDAAVTFAKMQNIATDRLVGRDTASSGSPEEISVGGGLEFTGSAGIQRSALTGDITAPAGDNATTLATVNVNVGTFGSATAVGQVTVNGKGLVTAAADVPIAITSAQVSDFTEAAQDAVGAMVNATLTYTDATPLLSINLGNANTWTATQTFAGVVVNGNMTIGDASGDTLTIAPNAITWSNNPTHSGNHTWSGADYRTGIDTPSQITGNQNNFTTPAGVSTVRFSTDADTRELRGLTSSGNNGRSLTLVNVGSFNLILAHENANANAANRFLCPNSTNLTLNPNDCVRVWYDTTSTRWRVIGV